MYRRRHWDSVKPIYFNHQSSLRPDHSWKVIKDENDEKIHITWWNSENVAGETSKGKRWWCGRETHRAIDHITREENEWKQGNKAKTGRTVQSYDKNAIKLRQNGSHCPYQEVKRQAQRHQQKTKTLHIHPRIINPSSLQRRWMREP